MAELKTQATTLSAEGFLKTIEPEEKQQDGFELLQMFQKITGEKPVMWGASIVGFGKYHYESEKSNQKGDWPLVAFSPRKQNLSLYILTGNTAEPALLEKLGKHKAGKGCLYVQRLSDIDRKVLEELIKKSFQYMKKTKL